jgi:Tol biopolymer transport system component
MMDRDGGNQLRLTDYPGVDQFPEWSPNGKQFSVHELTRRLHLRVPENTDGSDQRNLTPKDPNDLDGDWISRAPSWSTNGREIYFMSSRPSTGLDTEIFIMNRDGTVATRITNSIGMDGSPRSR